MASLPAPGGEHAAAAFGLHAGAETMRLVSSADVGLKRAFGHALLGRPAYRPPAERAGRFLVSVRADAGALSANAKFEYRGARANGSRRAARCSVEKLEKL